MRKVIKIELDSKNLKKISEKLDEIQKEIPTVNLSFIKKSCQWIYDRSIDILQEKDTLITPHISGIEKDIRTEIIPVGKNIIKCNLYYYNEIVAWVEFGTGIVGEEAKHPLADEFGYKYNSGEINSNNPEGRWNWYNPKYNIGMSGFQGYEGKRFIYEACQEFINKKIYVKIYSEEFNKMLNRYF